MDTLEHAIEPWGETQQRSLLTWSFPPAVRGAAAAGRRGRPWRTRGSRCSASMCVAALGADGEAGARLNERRNVGGGADLLPAHGHPQRPMVPLGRLQGPAPGTAAAQDGDAGRRHPAGAWAACAWTGGDGEAGSSWPMGSLCRKCSRRRRGTAGSCRRHALWGFAITAARFGCVATILMGFRWCLIDPPRLQPNLLDRRLIDGGLLILSRFPIVERDQMAFSRGSGSDGMCAKGALHARLQLSPDLSDSLHVFVTHTQAGDHRPDCEIRASQLHELLQFIGRTVRRDDDESASTPVLVTGDFNLDSRHDMVHDAASGLLVTSTKCTESQVYKHFVAELEGVLNAESNWYPESGRAPAKRERRVVVDLMKSKTPTRDSEIIGDEGELHPITNGDGHATLVHRDWTGDPQATLRDGKCIDYMFYSPGVSEASMRPTLSSASLLSPLAEVTTPSSDDGSITTVDSAATTVATISPTGTPERPESAAVTSPAPAPRFKLNLVEEKTRVEHCHVDDVIAGTTLPKHPDDDDINSGSTNASRGGLRLRKKLPITHLSDHYGLYAEFRVQTASPVAHPDGTPAKRFETLADVLQLHFPPHAFAQHPRRLWKVKLAVALVSIVAAAGAVLVTLIQAVGVPLLSS